MTGFTSAWCIIQVKNITFEPSELPVAGDHHQIPPNKRGEYHWRKRKSKKAKHEDISNNQLTMQISSEASGSHSAAV